MKKGGKIILKIIRNKTKIKIRNELKSKPIKVRKHEFEKVHKFR